jgi:hypothetical protein
MNPKACQGLPARRGEGRAQVSSVGDVLLSTMIMGCALLIITVLASWALLANNLIE